MPIEFEVLIDGLCAERMKGRPIDVETKAFGKTIETVTTREEENEVDVATKTGNKKSKSEVKTVKAKDMAWTLPEDNDELKQFIADRIRFCLGAVITNAIRGLNARASPPKGTRGMSRLIYNNHRLVKLFVPIDGIEVVGVKRNQEVQKHGIIRSNSAVSEYADTVTAKAKVSLRSLIETYGHGQKLLKNLLEYLDGDCYIGAFHNSNNGRVSFDSIKIT